MQTLTGFDHLREYPRMIDRELRPRYAGLHRAEKWIWSAFAVCGGLVILLAFGWALGR